MSPASDPGGRPARRWPGRVGFAVLGLAIGAVVAWAVTVALAPPTDVLVEQPYTFVELVDGEVGSSLSVNSVAAWTQVPLAVNRAAGTVTDVAVAAGASVGQGDVLYRVDLSPVVVAKGGTPAFRTMAPGMVGADVAQLQRLLRSRQLYPGKVTGSFGPTTTAAVRKWHRQLGVPAGDEARSGEVRLGEVVFVPSLPTRVALDPKLVSRGAILAGGEAVLSGLRSTPTFTLPVSGSQASLMPAGTRVEIRFGPNQWQAVTAAQKPDPQNGEIVVVQLAAVDSKPICRDACGQLPVDGQSLLASTVITQKAVKGIVAPTAALWSDPQGAASVIDPAGNAYAVTVVASARGMSVITGAPAGLRVRVPATRPGR